MPVFRVITMRAACASVADLFPGAQQALFRKGMKSEAVEKLRNPFVITAIVLNTDVREDVCKVGTRKLSRK